MPLNIVNFKGLPIGESQMSTILPSDHAINKTRLFCAEALELRDALLKKALNELNMLNQDACKQYLNMLKEETSLAKDAQTMVGEPFRGEHPKAKVSINIEQKRAQQQHEAEGRIQETLDLLALNHTKRLQMDMAMNEESKVFTGFTALDEEDHEISDVTVSDKLPHLFNDCAFAAANLVIIDSQVLQAESLEVIRHDAAGNYLPATKEQIEQIFDKMKKELADRHISFDINQEHDYQVIQRQLEEAPAVIEKEGVPEHVKVDKASAQRAPE